MSPKEHVIRCRAEREYSGANDEAFASNDALWLLREVDRLRAAIEAVRALPGFQVPVSSVGIASALPKWMPESLCEVVRWRDLQAALAPTDSGRDGTAT